MKHISVDSETWGKRAGDDVRSIGACLFDPESGYVSGNSHDSFDSGQSFYVACNNPLKDEYFPHLWHSNACDYLGDKYRKYNLRRDPETVKWWHEQAPEAQAAFDDPIDLRNALSDFTVFIHSHSSDIKDGQARDVAIWSHGAGFDPPIIEGLYHALEMTVPWYYRAGRDTRTAFDLAGLDQRTIMQRHQTGVFHHALDDALTQAKAISEAVMQINRWRDTL